MNIKLLSLILASSALIATACSESTETTDAYKAASSTLGKTSPVGRWYTQQQADEGGVIYQTHCASCHKPDASGTRNWRQTNANGKYPAPPLNGSAHTWHHPLKGLKNTIRMGGIHLGGAMPSFNDKLDNQQIEAVLAWVQTHWSDEIYFAWQSRSK